MRKFTLAKRLLSVALCAAIICTMCGCGGRELYERLIIHGIGVDADGDEFVVTVRSSVSPEDDGEEYFKCRGRTVLEALNSLGLSTGRKPFYAHNYLVVFGKACAEKGLDRCLDFFVRYYNTRPAVQMYLAQGIAEEILSFKKDDKYLKMSELQQLGDSTRDTGRTVGVEILDFVNGVKRQGGSAVLPVLQADDDGLKISATAYFSGYKLKGLLDLNLTRGYLAVKDKITDGEAVITTESHGTVTLTISKSSGDIKFIQGDVPGFEVNVTVSADVSAISNGRAQLENSGYGAVEHRLAEELEGEIYSALEQTVLEDGCDIFGLGALIYRKQPQLWLSIKDDWQTLMKACDFKISVTAKVKRLEQESLKNTVN